MKYALLALCSSLLLLQSIAHGQAIDTLDLNLHQFIQQAQGKTTRTTLARTALNNRYWNYTAFNGGFKPILSAEATLPEFNRSINQITQPDGDVTFTPQSYIRSDAGLRISQIVPSLGTRLDLYSGLQRLDILDDFDPTSKSYFATPISLGISQPLFQHNDFKWQREIQPLIYEEAEKQFIEDMEFIAFEAVNAYFNYYNAQLDFEAARLDKQNADSLYVLSQGRYNVGRIAETDLLQIELNVKSAESNRAQARIDMENSAEELRRILNIQYDVYFELADPEELTVLYIDTDRAISLAQSNRATSTAFRRRMLQAEKSVDEANKNNGLVVDINARFGLSQTDETIGGAYQNLLDQERISISLRVPIADWGRSQAEREIAQSQLELTKITIEQEEEQFEREIEIKIKEMDLLKNRLELSKSTYEVAQKRLDITRKRYYIGKIDVLNLNQAIIEKENSRKSYYQSLQQYYMGYYRIRLLTLYDFLLDAPIQYQR